MGHITFVCEKHTKKIQQKKKRERRTAVISTFIFLHTNIHTYVHIIHTYMFVLV